MLHTIEQSPCAVQKLTQHCKIAMLPYLVTSKLKIYKENQQNKMDQHLLYSTENSAPEVFEDQAFPILSCIC